MFAIIGVAIVMQPLNARRHCGTCFDVSRFCLRKCTEHDTYSCPKRCSDDLIKCNAIHCHSAKRQSEDPKNEATLLHKLVTLHNSPKRNSNANSFFP